MPLFDLIFFWIDANYIIYYFYCSFVVVSAVLCWLLSCWSVFGYLICYPLFYILLPKLVLDAMSIISLFVSHPLLFSFLICFFNYGFLFILYICSSFVSANFRHLLQNFFRTSRTLFVSHFISNKFRLLPFSAIIVFLFYYWWNVHTYVRTCEYWVNNCWENICT